MCVSIVYACVSAYACVCVRTFAHVCVSIVYACVCVCVSIVYACVCVSIVYACVCVCVYVQLHMCMCVGDPHAACGKLGHCSVVSL